MYHLCEIFAYKVLTSFG